jgi:transposase
VKLTRKQHEQLQMLVARPSAPAGVVRRPRVILLTAAGASGIDIAAQLDLSPESVSRIRRRFVHAGSAGLVDQPKSGRRDHAVPPDTVEQILQLALSPPPAGRSRWTTRLLAEAVGRTSGCVSDILRAQGLKPHLVRTYKASRDPAFAAKVADVVGLYLQPPEHAIVLSVDENTSIQGWSGRSGPLPLRTGRAVRHTHDYRRHGVLDLFAALEIATGKVTHRFSPAHTAADSLRFMKKVVRTYPDRDLHVVLDNSSTHNTEEARRWLAAHPRVQCHYTPTSASWLNQIEGFSGSWRSSPCRSRTSRRSGCSRTTSAPISGRGTRIPRPSNGRSRPTRSSNPTSGCLTVSRRRCTSRVSPAGAGEPHPALRSLARTG